MELRDLEEGWIVAYARAAGANDYYEAASWVYEAKDRAKNSDYHGHLITLASLCCELDLIAEEKVERGVTNE